MPAGQLPLITSKYTREAGGGRDTNLQLNTSSQVNHAQDLAFDGTMMVSGRPRGMDTAMATAWPLGHHHYRHACAVDTGLCDGMSETAVASVTFVSRVRVRLDQGSRVRSGQGRVCAAHVILGVSYRISNE